MIRRLIFLYFVFGSAFPAAWANTFTMFESVTIYVVQLKREGPVALDREQVLTQWDRKIELGLAPAYSFSRLFGMLQNASGGRRIPESSVDTPHIIVIAQRKDGSLVELGVSLETGVMVLKGGTLLDGELYSEVARFLVQQAGERLPEKGGRDP